MVRSTAREQGDGSPFRADTKAVGRNGGWESRTDAKVPALAEIAHGSRLVRANYASGPCTSSSPTADRCIGLRAGNRTTSPAAHSSFCRREGRMAEIGVTGSHAAEKPEPLQATAEEASLLGIQKGALVTRIRRPTTATRGGLWRRLTSSFLPPCARSSTKSLSVDCMARPPALGLAARPRPRMSLLMLLGRVEGR